MNGREARHPEPGPPAEVDRRPRHPLLRPERPPRRVRRKPHFALLAEADVAGFDVTVWHREAPYVLEKAFGLSALRPPGQLAPSRRDLRPAV